MESAPPRIALKVHTGNQRVLRVFMTDEVRMAHRFLQDTNNGLVVRTSVEVLSWAAARSWRLLAAVPATPDTTMLYLGP